MLVADGLFLGHDLLAWLVLAIGGAMAVGNAAALLRPPTREDGGDQAPAPRGRSMVYIVVGSVAALWAIATLLST